MGRLYYASEIIFGIDIGFIHHSTSSEIFETFVFVFVELKSVEYFCSESIQ